MEIDGIEYLTNANFYTYCAVVCDKRLCGDSRELREALRYISYVKRLITEFHAGGDLKERLVLNHIITLSNIFPPPHTARVLFFRMEKEHHGILKTFLSFLGMMPEMVDGLRDPVCDSDYPINTFVQDKLDAI